MSSLFKTLSRPNAIFLGLAMALTGGSLVRAQQPVYESASEFFTAGDFDGDGLTDLAIVDRSSGSVRVAYQDNTGEMQWNSVRDTGVRSVSGVAVGRLLANSRDALALTAPTANQVVLVDLSRSSASPVVVSPSGAGPSLVVAQRTALFGLENLIVATTANSGPLPEALEQLSPSPSFATLTSTSVVGHLESANRLQLHIAAPPTFGVFARGDTDAFRVYTPATPGPSLLLSDPLPSHGALQVNARFGLRTYTEFLYYVPGTSTLRSRPLTRSDAGIYALLPGSNLSLPSPIDRIEVISAAAENRLFVVFSGGLSASIYDFDGTNAPVLVQNLTPDSGTSFTGAGLWGSGDVLLYSKPNAGNGSSSGFQRLSRNGAGYTLGSRRTLPTLPTATGHASVWLFANDPFVKTNASLVGRLDGGDWTDSLVLNPPQTAFQIVSEQYRSDALGLGNATPSTLNPTFSGFDTALVNQYLASASLASLIPSSIGPLNSITVTPAGGFHSTAILLSFASSDPLMIPHYQIGAGSPWHSPADYTPIAPWVVSNAVVSYYAENSTTHQRTPLFAVTFSFPNAGIGLDSDHDGVPDSVEITHGLDPVQSGADGDRDGYTDAEEIAAGTNPTDPNSTPDSRYVHSPVNWNLKITPGLPGSIVPSNVVVGGFPVYVRTPSGLQVDQATALSPSATASKAVAVFSNLVSDATTPFVTASTDSRIQISVGPTSTLSGSELVHITASPDPTILRASTPGSILVDTTLTPEDTLLSVLVEKAIRDILLRLGHPEAAKLSLFPWRASDKHAAPLSANDIAWIESPKPQGAGISIRDLIRSIEGNFKTSSLPAVVNLRRLANDVYQTFLSGIQPIQRGGARSILFCRNIGSNGEIWVVRPDGTGEHRLTIGFMPRLSPDGRWMSFLRDGATTSYTQDNLYVRNMLDGTETRLVVNSDHIVASDFTQDSKSVVFDYVCSIDLIHLDGTGRRTLLGSGFCWQDAPVTNPKDDRLAWHDLYQGQLGIANPDGSNRKYFTPVSANYSWPQWSHDGTTLLAVDGNNRNRSDLGVNLHRLTLADPVGFPLTQLTEKGDGFPGGATWTPDDQSAIGVAVIHGRRGLYQVSTDGQGTLREIPVSNPSTLYWVGNTTSFDIVSSPLGLVSLPASGPPQSNATDISADGTANNLEPIDTLRRALSGDSLPSDYLSGTGMTAEDRASAISAVTPLLAAIPEVSFVVRTLQVGVDTFTSGCIWMQDASNAAPVALVNAAGSALTGTALSSLPPGTLLSVKGRMVTNAVVCGGSDQAIEVVSYSVLSLPSSTSSDSDGNQLPDAWELLFFGSIGVNPQADPDRDGFTNLQEYAGGSDPTDPLSKPVVSEPVPTRLRVELNLDGTPRVEWEYPSSAAGRIQFGLESAADPNGPFEPIEAQVWLSTEGFYFTNLPSPGSAAARYYRLRITSR